MKVLCVFGTRPEAIKMCPLILKLKEYNCIECVVCVTGQHKEMLKQVMDSFSVQEDYNLNVMKESQSLSSITTSILKKIEPILIKENPNIVLVHGDTTTAFASSLAAFYHKIPVGHVEAGLRTSNIYSPFPEEMNRVLIDRISTFYFAPTELNKSFLQKEGIRDNIFVTGNTVIDSFKYTVKNNYHFDDNVLNNLDFSNNKVIVLTAHRRENIGKPLINICNAVKRISLKYKNVTFVYPVHLNPAIKQIIYPILFDINNVILLKPVNVLDMHNLLDRCYMVMTDSGGLQEEAPHFGKPVLVLRKETERPEAVKAGTVKVVGINEEKIYQATRELIENNKEYERMAMSINPYGDGNACEKIIKVLLNRFIY